MTAQERSWPESHAQVNTRRAYSTLAVLVLIMMFNNIDRYIMAVLVEPIKRDLSLSDTQIGILTGFAFSAFYALAAVPLARISDSGRRYSVIWICTIVWSVMTAACGLVQNFIHLVLARFMVGTGEAGALPAGNSLLCDIFPPERRNTAVGFFIGSAGLGVFFAFAVGGALEQAIGWRWTFAAVGLPGLLLAALFLLTVKDPRKRSEFAGPAFRPSELYSAAIAMVREHPALLYLYIGAGFMAFLQLGVPQWLPAFLERSHGIDRATIGLMLATANSPGILIGTFAGGPLADMLSKRNRIWPARLIFLSSALSVVPLMVMLLSNSIPVVLVGIFLGALGASLPSGLIFAMSQTLVQPHQRATAAACLIIFSSFIGMGALPLLTGMLSDGLAAAAGGQSLRWALMITIPLAAAPMIYGFFRVYRTLSSTPPKSA